MDLCCNGEVYSWIQEVITEKGGKKYLEDVYIGKKENEICGRNKIFG